MKIVTKNSHETKRVARDIARKVLKFKKTSAVVIALEGNLGAGKTTFTQAFAQELGIKEKVLSPTFVLMKVYPLQIANSKSQIAKFRYLIHIDCYRIDSPGDLEHLGFKKLLKDKDAIILIEWADRVKKLLPKDTIWVNLKHGNKINTRIINIESRIMD